MFYLKTGTGYPWVSHKSLKASPASRNIILFLSSDETVGALGPMGSRIWQMTYKTMNCITYLNEGTGYPWVSHVIANAWPTFRKMFLVLSSKGTVGALVPTGSSF